MDPRLPSGSLAATLIPWGPEALLHRIHRRERGPAEFNPTTLGNARFSPLLDDAAGKVVPTLYAARTLDCALMETVFHDVAYSPDLKYVRKKTHLTGWVSSLLKTTRPLTLIDLSAIALHNLGITRKHLLETEKDQYPGTRAWALALYTQFPSAQGLLWTSRQDDRAQACILFGTRVGAEALEPAAAPESLLNTDGSARMEVLALARRLGVDIVD